MAEREIKTTLALDGEKAFKASMDEAYRGMKVLGSEMKLNTSIFGDNGKSMEGLTQKSELLGKQIAQQKEIVAALSKAVEDSAAAYGENDKRTDAYRIKLNNASAALNKMEGDLDANRSAIENFGRGTEDAEKKTLSWKESLEKVDAALDKGIAVTQAALAGIVAFGAAVLATGKQLFDLTVETGKFADGLLTTSQQTGISTTALQEWGYASQFIDTEVTTITGSIAKMTKGLLDASEGTGKNAEAYARLGVSVTDAGGNLRSTEEIFFDAIDALGMVANETERDALAMQLFGKSALELNPLIVSGSEAFRALGQEASAAGIIMSEEAVNAAGAFDDKMNVLNATVAGVKNSIAVSLTPAFESIIKIVQDVTAKFNEWLQSDAAKALIGELSGKITDLANDIGNNLTPIIEGAISAFDTIFKTIGWVIDNIGLLKSIAIALTATLVTLKVAQIAVNIAMAANPIGLIITAIGLLVTAVVLIAMNFDKFKETVVKVWESVKTAASNAVKDIVGFFGDLWENLKAFPEKMLNIGVNIIKGIWEGIKSMSTWFWEQLKQWFSDSLGWIGKLLGIKSPSRVMADKIGKPMAQGVAKGILDNAKLVDQAMASMVPDKTSMALDVTRQFNDSYTLGTRKSSQLSVSLSESAVGQIINGFKAALTDQGDTVLIMNDREFGRAVRKVALA